jgi:hypothetical protein
MFEPSPHELTQAQIDAWRVAKLDPWRGRSLELDGVADNQDLRGHSGVISMVITPRGFVRWAKA